jgi:hypothetical protein
MTVLAEITSDAVLDAAYAWLCRCRRDYSANSDVWAFRREWTREKQRIKEELHAGSYRFSLLSRITREDGEETDLWCARDAVVLKALALALVLGAYLRPRAAARTSRATAAPNTPCARSVIICRDTASCRGPT